ncbi:imelysin family protein [Tenacibaculum finnmarkense]|uniref:Peptidase M75 n=1 Tax=Tenacibaculum finnmarkense genomovar finnmarkense TaxID=1458503 RepID=A0AAP1REI2_9FLAO|nr:imelysin family protein [Tenacibaculum finnmarkense]MBE7694829.1 peptidase M75 [Tenacibaculum finnmarkense genomovar finnmarkense]MCG8752885.1 peptidase M75 [Tenacibaculum finnmarkense]MCG8769931.1 peptidase M75 [Tenacibaculum finnmarkense]MCG8776370.1 peptidase M75 [Tenacibaculum finnmarkense]MCG8871990.1 peptidase M75 [Tenacibaculum finnmarkense]
MKKVLGLSLLLATSFVFKSCSDEDTPTQKATKQSFIENYAAIASANYEDSYTTALKMQIAINAFLAKPTTETHKAAKKAWLYSRDFYGQTEAFREAKGPIDNEDLLGSEGQINAWPLDEAYIDYVSGDRGQKIAGGLIADASFALTEKNIIDKNEDGKDDNISTGWHAIEFLLWGQDLNYNTTTHKQDNFKNAGVRSFTDYTTEASSERRAEYLKIVTNLLVNDLKDLNSTWAVGGTYRTAFAALKEKTALTNILNGIGFIANGEVALERLDPAIDEGQENEHSCFSDNTNQDMWANTHGINNVVVGSYTRADGSKVSGTSLIALTETVNKDVAASLDSKAKATLAKLDALLGLDKPFDEIISEEELGSNGTAGQLSSALKAEGKAIAEAAKTLDVTISIN